MKKKIAILGSTGSIGKSLLKIISRDKNNFTITLLSAKKNYKQILKQADYFNVKNIIITDNKYYKIAKRKIKNRNLKIFNNFDCFDKIFKNKIEYTMSSIVGLDGLKPTMNIIKYTKKIAIANKESIICAWNLIYKELKKNKTQFVPVDSEHFSIWYGLKNINSNNVDKIYITASGGSLLNVSKKKFANLSLKKILKHPNWKMGKKITLDSSTLMNKVFEVIEAKNIFNLKYNQIEIIIHPSSYVHAIIKYNNGMINIIAHDTTMEIPIFNSIYDTNLSNINTNRVNFKKLNNLNFKNVNEKKFKLVKILKKLPIKNSLYETLIVSANDTLVGLFLKKKINYVDISVKLMKFINRPEFKKLKKILPRNILEVIKLSEYVRNKIIHDVYKI